MTRFLRLVLSGTLLTLASANAAPPVTVGIEGQLEVWLPASDLKARPPERNALLTVRMAAAEPHEQSTRYDLRYIGVVPGRYDLRGFLMHEDGSPAADLPPLEVRILGLLATDHQGALEQTPVASLPFLGGYRLLLGCAGAAWLGGAFLLFRHRRRKQPERPVPATAPMALVERLRPLVLRAASGQFAAGEKAELERLILGHWRERLGLEDLHPFEALARLREHAEAGALLRSLEEWLHCRPGSVLINLDPLLAAYAAEGIETAPPSPAP